MSNDRDATRIVRSWLEEGVTRLPDQILDAVVDQLPATPQRRAGSPTWRSPVMNTIARLGLAAAAAVAVVFVGAQVIGLLGTSPEAGSTASPEPSASMLPRLRLPGTSPNEPAGEYGWEGSAGSTPSGPQNGMHRVVDDGPRAREATAILFSAGPDCLGAFDVRDATNVRVAGLTGVFIEPYEPPVTFGGADGGDVTRAYALEVEDRTLCVFVTWLPETTPEELREALAVLETIRAQPIGSDGVRINFTLPSGWDTG